MNDSHEQTHLGISGVGMARYHNFGFGTIPECNTSVSIP